MYQKCPIVSPCKNLQSTSQSVDQSQLALLQLGAKDAPCKEPHASKLINHNWPFGSQLSDNQLPGSYILEARKGSIRGEIALRLLLVPNKQPNRFNTVQADPTLVPSSE